ncbi:CheR family methyltransferase [Thermodesulfobacteriota bacterium]
MVKITPDEFQKFSKYIYGITGIVLGEGKAYLLETRLSSLLAEKDCASFSELFEKIQFDSGKVLTREIINRITTNETSFFRDNVPFELLQHKIVPDLIDQRTPSSKHLKIPINIWSAACSTGQEIYSTAIVLRELLSDIKQYNIKLMGTDISDAAIDKASYGLYNQFEIGRGLSKEKKHKYFVLHESAWKIKDEIRAMVTFRKQNLLLPFEGVAKFDIILCRNVAIYFNIEDRKKLFNRIADILNPDGYLIVGVSEPITGICPRFEPKRYLRSIFYQLKE